ncbi:MAG: site-2 protease family protein [Lachnospiraceae bacterium]|nr:site-2 protease family protein [Lachnospiraceae bacterium]
MSILLFLLVFFIIVVSHEFGHFIVAKAGGVRVIEFAIGMGPKLIGFKKNGTKYVLRALPIGGACVYDTGLEEALEEVMADDKASDDAVAKSSDNADDKAGEDAGFLDEMQGIAYTEAPLLRRIGIVLAGPVFNFIVAYLLALIVVWYTGSSNAEITSVMDGYPAQEAGLMPGDIITKMNGSRVYLANEIYVNTYTNKERPLTIEYERDGKKYTTTIIPKYNEESGRYLMGLDGYGTYVSCKNASIFKYAYYEERYAFVGTWKSLIALLSGRGSKDDVAGPVGMAQAIDDVKDAAAPYGPWVVLLNMFNIAMLLSVNLGILNLLPLPAIDGGKLLFLFVEGLRGKPIPPEKEGIVHLVGFALLAILAIVVMYNDILRIIAS